MRSSPWKTYNELHYKKSWSKRVHWVIEWIPTQNISQIAQCSLWNLCTSLFLSCPWMKLLLLAYFSLLPSSLMNICNKYTSNEAEYQNEQLWTHHLILEAQTLWLLIHSSHITCLCLLTAWGWTLSWTLFYKNSF